MTIGIKGCLGLRQISLARPRDHGHARLIVPDIVAGATHKESFRGEFFDYCRFVIAH